MGYWSRFFGGSRGRESRDEHRSLLPRHHERLPSAVDAKEVTKVALKLRYQIETVIPCELEASSITKAHSAIITPQVIKTASEAGGKEYRNCVVYCLLVCKKWFKRQGNLELWDADLFAVRSLACEVIAKRIIEAEQDMAYLYEKVLLQRFSILVDGEETSASNVIERAVDMHALMVIGSSGYQKCNSHLWRGWLVQDDTDTSRFVPYKEKTNTSYWAHFDPDRMRVPKYQNALQIAMSLIYLGLYTGAINTINNPGEDIDIVEALLYIFTLGFIMDEIAKIWKIGRYYIGFWNIFNSALYSLVTVSFVLRIVALSNGLDSDDREFYNTLSYNFLAFTAPMFWMRLMLYLDTFRFFGAMLVVVKVMMKESIIFFALLAIVLIGFFQGFVGLDQSADRTIDQVELITKNMFNAIMTSPEFDAFDQISPPFGLVLYYIYTFVIMVVLLNILIALYNSAYEDITGNAVDEYMALFAGKTLQFARAPDENVYIAPFNLLEIFLLVIPFEWWLSSKNYEKVNDIIMGALYSPLLAATAWLEQRDAINVQENRRKGEEDDDTVEEWEELNWKPEVEDKEWAEKVKQTSPNVEVDGVTLLLREMRKELAVVKELLGHKEEDDKKKASSSTDDAATQSQKPSGENGTGNEGFGLKD